MSTRSEPQRQNDWLTSPFTWVAVLIALAALAVGMRAVLSDDDGPADAAAETATSVVVTGTPLAPLAAPDTAVGSAAPVVTSELLGGGSVELGGDGVARLIGFFAHWCPHCQAEVPAARDWLRDIDLPPGVEVAAVSTSVDPTADNYPPSRWFSNEDWPTPVVLDDADGTIARAYGLTGFPFWVAVAADGTVVARRSGSIDEAQFLALMSAIDPARSTP